MTSGSWSFCALSRPNCPSLTGPTSGRFPRWLIGAATGRPDIAVGRWQLEPPPDLVQESSGDEAYAAFEPDEEVATIVLDPQTAVFVTEHGRWLPLWSWCRLGTRIGTAPARRTWPAT
jgi:hypothetical protein